MSKRSKHEAVIRSRLTAIALEVQTLEHRLELCRREQQSLEGVLAQAEEEGRESTEEPKGGVE